MWTMITCPVFFMAVRSSPLRIPARRRWLLPVLVLVCNPLLVTCAPTPVPDTTTPIGEDPRKRSANVWPGEQYLWTENRVLEVYPDGVVNSSAKMNPVYALVRVSTTIPYSENVNFAETSHPLGIPDNVDWLKKPQTVKPEIVITIYGKNSGHYVCMNRRGRVYGAKNYTDECYFNHILTEDTEYTLFSSYKYSGERPSRKKSRQNSKSKDSNKKRGKPWYLGLKMNGVMKGYKTDKNNPKVWFLPKPWKEYILEIDTNRPEMPSTPPPESPFGRNRPGGQRPSNRERGMDSPFGGGPAQSTAGRKRKCNELFVFPVLEGCRTKGRRRHRHSSNHKGTRKPRKRHRQTKKAKAL